MSDAEERSPWWAILALLVIAAVAALAYSLGTGNYLEIYYAAAARSMSQNWHNFYYAAFDPAATVSIDKLPGAIWLQALAIKAFGVHPLVIVLPQVAEGVITVIVTYHAVRHLAGTVAGLSAAGVLAVLPATVALNRGNIPDSLMILLCVAAVDCVIAAVAKERPGYIWLAGLFVGLAFQAKMLEAWLVLPALGVGYVLASPRQLWKRCLDLCGSVAVAAAVSFSWMTAISLGSSAHRPYVDGSQDNSVFQQVFVYNGFGRFDQLSPDQILSKTIGLGLASTKQPAHAKWDRLLTGSYGLDAGWLLPLAVIALVAGLVALRRQPRTDLLRLSLVVWGVWLVTLGVTFSVGSINSYYTAALSPPIAALCATGGLIAWQHRDNTLTRVIVAVALAGTAAYAAWLLPSHATGMTPWLKPVLVGTAAAGAVSVAIAALIKTRRLLLGGLCLQAGAALFAPVAASVSIVADRLGPFDTPYQPPSVTAYISQTLSATPANAAATLPTIESVRKGARYLMATQSSAIASPFIFATGTEVLPIGGFTGTQPEPTLKQLKHLITEGYFHLVLQSPTSTDPRLEWIASHCINAGVKRSLAIYYCLPGSVAG